MAIGAKPRTGKLLFHAIIARDLLRHGFRNLIRFIGLFRALSFSFWPFAMQSGIFPWFGSTCVNLACALPPSRCLHCYGFLSLFCGWSGELVASSGLCQITTSVSINAYDLRPFLLISIGQQFSRLCFVLCLDEWNSSCVFLGAMVWFCCA